MEKSSAIAALAALAQDNRLDAFRLLVKAGPSGLAAGQIATTLGLPPNTLTFHFDRLRQAGLVTVKRDGRSMIYAARYEVMNALVGYLTENCCKGAAPNCAPSTRGPACRETCEGKSMNTNGLPIAIIGGGPVGLAAAAHLLTRGVPLRLYEAGESAAANVRSWGHVRLFSPWGFNIDPAAAALLRHRGWQEPKADIMPTGA